MNYMFFFFSSRRRHTRLQGDWSSDVCSSDLPDIYINGNWVGRREVQFKAQAGSQDALPCLDKALLEKVGIDLSRLPPEAALKLAADGGCNRLDQIIAGAFTSFDFGKQRLDLSVPQASLRRSVRGYVSPDQWSAGVPVGLLGYQFNTYHGRSSNAENTTQDRKSTRLNSSHLVISYAVF